MNSQCLGADPTRAEFNTVSAVHMAEDMKDMRLLEKFVIHLPSSSINLRDAMTVNTLLQADVMLENAQKVLPLEMVFNHHKSKWTFLLPVLCIQVLLS